MKTRRKYLALAVAVAAAAALAIGTGGATGATVARHATCDSSAFKTLLANGTVRIYKSHGRFYACERSGGPSRRFGALFGPSSGRVSDIQLAGNFIGWYQVSGQSSGIGVLNVKTGARRSDGAGTCCSFVQSDDVEFVVNSRGTIVSLEAAQFCGGTPRACSFTNSVNEDSGHGRTTLDSEQNASAPVGQLALSQSGRYVYWLGSDGKPHSARIT
jgi:hypothetical protein